MSKDSRQLSVRLGADTIGLVEATAWEQKATVSDIARTALIGYATSYAEEHGGVHALVERHRQAQIADAEATLAALRSLG